MNDFLPLLKNLLNAPGLSGYEMPVCNIIAEAWKPLTDEIAVSKLGSLHAIKHGKGAQPRKRVMLSAHMDAIGLMVTGIKDGLLRFTEIGGIDHRILPGQSVIVHGRQSLPGIVIQPPAFLLPEQASKGPVEMQYLMIDVGLHPQDVSQLVRAGDVISFGQEPLEMSGETLAGHTLDNRVSVAAVTVCLDLLQRRYHQWDVWAVASSQEEETLGGALTSSFDIMPDFAIVIDVCFAKGPGGSDWAYQELGKGLGLGWGANIHPALYKTFKEKAEELEIPYSKELAPSMSGTDAMAIQVVQAGIPCMVLGIPLRYMHTPVELVSLKDIKRVGRLMAEVITDLQPAFVESINWEE
jgi:endoglucanase